MRRRVRFHPTVRALALTTLLALPAFSLAAADTAKADANRKKPLQRCDQLKDDAQLQCLQKARERVVEERRKREARDAPKSGKDGERPK